MKAQLDYLNGLHQMFIPFCWYRLLSNFILPPSQKKKRQIHSQGLPFLGRREYFGMLISLYAAVESHAKEGILY